MRNKRLWIVILLIAAFVVPYLPNWIEKFKSTDTPPAGPEPVKPAVTVNVPAFNADSAYAFVEKQVSFGPRVPGSTAHKKCADWLVQTFEGMGMTVVRQPFKAKTYFGTLDAVNIIAQYKPELKNRVLLCAHWDSRHIADNDTKDQEKPILGADDGASGVGVMLEIARILQQNPIDMGVDLICFDAEDLGDDREEQAGSSMMTQNNNQAKAKTWCLGSQHWSRNLHKPGYSAQFGILLDMVGARGAVFPKESYSANNAPRIQGQIWNIAAELGYGTYFPMRDAGYVTDDHVFVMQGAGIPTVDIISIPNQPPHSFGAYHHTHDDNMTIIDRNTLNMVGRVVSTVLYRKEAGVFL
ncbi:MAG: M28 family peptidase [Bacteroidetes bacterium]|nr:MAG: M28 family peptidase [Bacteroidota bacterium]